MKVGGDPAVINDVSVRLLDGQHELESAADRHAPPLAAPTVVAADPVLQVSPALRAEAGAAVAALAQVLASDSYHLQRAGHELHEALNGPGAPPRFGSPGGPVDEDRRFGSPGGPVEEDRRFGSPGGPVDEDRRFGSPGGPVEEDRRIGSPGGPVDEDRRFGSPGVLHPTPGQPVTTPPMSPGGPGGMPPPQPVPPSAVRPLPEPITTRAALPPSPAPVAVPPRPAGGRYVPSPPPPSGRVTVAPRPGALPGAFRFPTERLLQVLPDFRELRLLPTGFGRSPQSNALPLEKGGVTAV